MTKHIDKFLNSKYGIETIVTIVLITIALMLVAFKTLEFKALGLDLVVNLTVLTTSPLLIIAVIQLRRNFLLQRTDFIREFTTKLYNERELSESFYYLVYLYENNKYKEFKKADEIKDDVKKKEMQKDKKEGMKFYNPATFQDSEEERRLDVLLGFFNILGYHYHSGIVSIEDIAGVMEFYLVALSTRKVIVEYMEEIIPDNWEKTSFAEYGDTPYRHLRNLLRDFRKFNKTHKQNEERK